MARGLRWILAGAVLVAAVVAAAETLAPLLVARAVRGAAIEAGFAEASVHGVRVGLDRATIGAIDLDAEGRNTVGPISIRYSVSGLVAGRVEGVVVEGLALGVAIDDDGGVSLAGVPLAAGPGGDTALPVGRLEVRQGSVVVATPAGPVELRIADGSASDMGGALAATTRIVVLHEYGRVEAYATARLAGNGIDVVLDGLSGRLAHPGLAVPSVTGRATLRRAADGVLGFSADLAAPVVSVVDAAFRDATVTFAGDGHAVAVTVAATGPAGAVVAGEGRVPLGGDEAATARLRVAVPDLAALGSRLAGALEVTADLSGTASVGVDGTWRVEGDVGMSLSDGSAAGLADGLRARLAARVAATPDRVDLAATEPWRIAGTLAPDLGLPSPFAGALSLVLAAVGDEPARAVATRAPGGWTLRVSAPFALRGSDVALDGRVADASLDVDDEGRVTSFRIGGLTASAPVVAVAGSRALETRLALDLAGTSTAWSGTATIASRLALPWPGGVSVRDLGVAATAELGFADGVATARVADCATIDVVGLVVHGFALEEPTAFCLRDLAAEVRPGDWTLRAALASGPFAGSLARAQGPLHVSGTLPAAAATVSPAGLDADLAGGAVALPDLDLDLDGLSGRLAWGANEEATAELEGRLSHRATPSWFAPLGLSARATVARDGAIDITAAVDDPSGALAIDVAARHDPALGVGWADAELFPATFVPGLRPPSRLFPILGSLVEDATGTVAATARATWTGSGLGGEATVKLDGLSATIGPARVEALNGVVRFDRLWPPAMPPGQRVSVGLVDLGVPLTDGLVSFWMAPNGRVSVDKAEWRWAGGTVGAAPFTARLDDPGWAVVLEAKDLDLAEILTLVGIEGLTGTGRLAGSLPLSLNLDTIAVEDGVLAATAPGVLRYAPSASADVLGTGEGGTSLLLDALRNFRYEKLALSIDGVAGAETTVGLRVEGRNPDLYGGYPVALNVNLSGALDTILRRGLAGYRIPDEIRRQLESYGERAP
jgi:hypothetical protein